MSENNVLMSRDEYINTIEKPVYKLIEPVPVFKCPMCGDIVRKDLNNVIALTSNPPQIKYLHKCDLCDYSEYI